MAIYLAGASVVFGLLLNAFIKDDTTPKTHILSWVVLLVATLIWPIVLPSIVGKKLRRKPQETSEETVLELGYQD